MRELRCVKCNSKLAMQEATGKVEILCRKCKTINCFTLTKENKVGTITVIPRHY